MARIAYHACSRFHRCYQRLEKFHQAANFKSWYVQSIPWISLATMSICLRVSTENVTVEVVIVVPSRRSSETCTIEKNHFANLSVHRVWFRSIPSQHRVVNGVREGKILHASCIVLNILGSWITRTLSPTNNIARFLALFKSDLMCQQLKMSDLVGNDTH